MRIGRAIVKLPRARRQGDRTDRRGARPQEKQAEQASAPTGILVAHVLSPSAHPQPKASQSEGRE